MAHDPNPQHDKLPFRKVFMARTYLGRDGENIVPQSRDLVSIR